MALDGLRGKGMLVVFNEVEASDEVDFNEWYNREHIDERINLPGFTRARRYVAVRGSPKYLATYECSNVTDLCRPGYLQLLANQTDWSQRVMRRFTTFRRLTMRVRVDLAHGVGGVATCVRFVPGRKHVRALTAWLNDTALPAAIREPGLTGGFAAENVLDVSNAPARAQGSAYLQSGDVEWVVVLEGGVPEATAAAAKRYLSRHILTPYGVRVAPVVGTYRLMFSNET